MPIRLYNTLSQKLEDFVPLDPSGKVTMYVCGITTYDRAHAGHARTYTTFDVLYRLLRARGHEVVHCRNVTDVDDRIVDRGEAERRRSARPLEAQERPRRRRAREARLLEAANQSARV